jgi:hypothetical protein
MPEFFRLPLKPTTLDPKEVGALEDAELKLLIIL